MDRLSGKGRVAVVTGGAGGIGRVICRTLTALGWRVVVCDINEDSMRDVAAECGARFWRMDILDRDDVEGVADAIEAEMGPVAAVVHAAATFQPLAPAEDTSVEEWDRIAQLVHRGTFLVAVAFGKRMAARGAGSFVGVSSWNGVRAARMHAYCSSKAAVNLLMESMAVEWGRSGVRFNTVSPGVVMTPRVAERIATGQRYTVNPIEMTALGRLVTSEEVADTIAFMVSDMASGISGANLLVDTGTAVTQAWTLFGGIPGARPRLAESTHG
ncbi:NAD(P)-dependent dehydrogenase (short-subunit alcohol dehydrogenase family) [Kerstersia gyiorum]|uniref:NAD(P)-dependent dehydrogenase (Short-subunit alcohol dehydrogenase family) n=1 Tax=Kerstersia gyiorum TaxID=206506 RepID=A0A4Q7MGW3_9BURK|nr:SDR family oxidoreductase [Kerstersia gyiorum]KAB0542509.1 SDR family oxidoreductase [Kerstersia gyiorum]RZS66733.1 NAD(P)-dependent dehydrogenase (short-subunit alcohol dehydrogenase family) [Kerstersia gyiorum]